MKNEAIVRIAALVSELGKIVRDGLDVLTPEQDALMRSICAPTDAANAVKLALGVAVATSDQPARHLLDTVLLAAGAMAPLHKDNRTKPVTRADVLRLVADYVEKEDRAVQKVKDVLDRLLALPKVEPASKPGAN